MLSNTARVLYQFPKDLNQCQSDSIYQRPGDTHENAVYAMIGADTNAPSRKSFDGSVIIARSMTYANVVRVIAFSAYSTP